MPNLLNIRISPTIRFKLESKHKVSEKEIHECFYNRVYGLLEDTRENNKTTPPTRWFIAETDHGRLLKIVFVRHDDGCIYLKTAYEPNKLEVNIYEKHAR